MKTCLQCQNEFRPEEKDCPYCNGRMLKLSEDDIAIQQVTIARLRVVYPPPFFMDWQVKVDIETMAALNSTIFCAVVIPNTHVAAQGECIVAIGYPMRQLYQAVQGIKWGRV